METAGRLVAGSHNRRDFVVINADDSGRLHSSKESNRHTCRICGDGIEIAADGEPFVACVECAFPVCRACYAYERREGNQSCPQCRTRYKRHIGCARVEGDEEEENADDIDNEFVLEDDDAVEPELKKEVERNVDSNHYKVVPLLTYHGELGEIPDCSHALVVSETARSVPDPYASVALQPRALYPEKDLSTYGCGTIAWTKKMERWKNKQSDSLQMAMLPDGSCGTGDFDDPNLPMMDEGRQPLSRKLPLPSSKINPYRIIIILRLVILGFFFHYRLLHPVPDAYGLWMISVICEIWFALSWILDQFSKWRPIERETYLDRLSLRYEVEGRPSELAGIDVFVSTVDPMKNLPLSLQIRYCRFLRWTTPVDKVACYISDDGASMLTFETLSETAEFARKWVPFCRKFKIEPCAPEWYFLEKIDYLKDKIHLAFVRERRAMKREYEEFKVHINKLVALAEKVPEEGWALQDGTMWPGNIVRDHPGMIQVLLGQHNNLDAEGNCLPRLIYVSREKRPGFDHHKKAGAMNALVRVSAIMSNGPYILNVDCDHYINNSKALREAMCFMMDSISGKKVCYVQFPQRFDGIDRHDRYSNRNVVFFDVNMKGLDGFQGPVCVGTGCVFRRHALYGFDAPAKKKTPTKTCSCWPKWCCSLCHEKRKNKKGQGAKEKRKIREASKQVHALESMENENRDTENDAALLMPEGKLEKKFGQSPAFVASTIQDSRGVPRVNDPAVDLNEALQVASCGYEEKTEWGKEVGWIYGSVMEDILTGFKIHCHGWRSVYCMPKRPAFKGSAPINLSDRLHQVLCWALGSVEIFLSKHCPLWYGYSGGLKWLERFSYINSVVYPWTSIPLITYCTLPAFCLLSEKFIIPEMNIFASVIYLALFISIAATGIAEMYWGGVSMDDWWRNEQFWVIGGVSSHFFALIQGLFKVLAGIETNFTVTSKCSDDGDELYTIKWTSLLVVPTTLFILNVVGVLAGISSAVNGGYDSWGSLLWKLFFAMWVILHLYPFIKGLMGKQDRVPTIIVVWSLILVAVCSLLWVRINPFIPKYDGPVLEVCGLDCIDDCFGMHIQFVPCLDKG